MIRGAGRLYGKARQFVTERTPSALSEQYEEGYQENTRYGPSYQIPKSDDIPSKDPREIELKKRRAEYYHNLAENVIAEQEVDVAEKRKDLDLRRKAATKNSFGKYPEDVESEEAKIKRDAEEQRKLKLEEARLNLQYAREREKRAHGHASNPLTYGNEMFKNAGRIDMWGNPRNTGVRQEGRNAKSGYNTPSKNIFGASENNNGFFDFGRDDLDIFGRHQTSHTAQQSKSVVLDRQIQVSDNRQQVQPQRAQTQQKDLFNISNMFADVFDFSNEINAHENYDFSESVNKIGIGSRARAHGNHILMKSSNLFADVFYFGENEHDNNGKSNDGKAWRSKFNPLGFLDFGGGL